MHSNDDHLLYRKPPGVATKWFTLENPTGAKGSAATSNQGAKGHVTDLLPRGGSISMLDYQGSGVIRSIWITHMHYELPMVMRSLRIEISWDGAATPAVNVPLGDFFCGSVWKRVPFENELFGDPEGRCYNCSIPMPFRTGARMIVVNDSTDMDIEQFYYCVGMTVNDAIDPSALYFHAYWNRENLTRLGGDFRILPPVKGGGRYLGANIQVRCNPAYLKSWFGEGEVKIYLDGDTSHPTLAGTGTEDYICSAWGQGVFRHQRYGSLCADPGKGLYSFYRLHTTDPVYFDRDCMVTLQQIGTAIAETYRLICESDAKHRPIYRVKNDLSTFVRLLDEPAYDPTYFAIEPDDYCVGYYREDDVSAAAYFYLDRPENGLSPQMRLEGRISDL